MLPSGKEHEFTGKNIGFSPVLIISIQGTRFEYRFTGKKQKISSVNMYGFGGSEGFYRRHTTYNRSFLCLPVDLC